MHSISAQTRMKAYVASRLLMGHFETWDAFESERETAAKIINRKIARSISAQIGQNYRDLSHEIKHFLDKNFKNASIKSLANLCDDVAQGEGIYLPLKDFESNYFELSDEIKSGIPTYSHVSVTTFGFQFEFPEHHFMRDLEVSLRELALTERAIEDFVRSRQSPKTHREEIANLQAREKFLCRSAISSASSLVEAFLSGLLYTALKNKKLGSFDCDLEFITFSHKKESASTNDRISYIVERFSSSRETVAQYPFPHFLYITKRYRDSIHHTTPFERKGSHVKPGERLTLLYEVDIPITIVCVLYSLDCITKIIKLCSGQDEFSSVFLRCADMRRLAIEVKPGMALPELCAQET